MPDDVSSVLLVAPSWHAAVSRSACLDGAAMEVAGRPRGPERAQRGPAPVCGSYVPSGVPRPGRASSSAPTSPRIEHRPAPHGGIRRRRRGLGSHHLAARTGPSSTPMRLEGTGRAVDWWTLRAPLHLSRGSVRDTYIFCAISLYEIPQRYRRDLSLPRLRKRGSTGPPGFKREPLGRICCPRRAVDDGVRRGHRAPPGSTTLAGPPAAGHLPGVHRGSPAECERITVDEPRGWRSRVPP